MKALNSEERSRLAKVLALLGSPHAGERDAAALAAARFVQSRSLNWPQVLKPPPVEKQLPELGTWRQTVARCLQQPSALRPWERQFLTDLPGFRRLTVKQRYILDEIAGRVLRGGE